MFQLSVQLERVQEYDDCTGNVMVSFFHESGCI